jgi:AcrR family transcriptional regulator
MPRLDADRIAAAAWKIVDERGLRAFTIRAVAEELGISAMAIYHHLSDKAALAALMIEKAHYERPLASPTGDWRDDLWHMAKWLREVRLAHPALPGLRRNFGVWSPALLAISERWVTFWLQSGLASNQALLAARASSQAIVGMVDEEAVYEAEEPPAEDMLASTPVARVLFTKDHSQDKVFELAVRSIIDGLYSRISAQESEVSAS